MTLAAESIALRLGGRAVLDGVSIAAAPGELVGLIGPNAAGKTTLVRVLAGLIAPDAGAVTLDGRPLAAIPRAERARAVAYLEQDAVCHWPLAVRRLVALGRLPWLGPFQRAGPADEAAITQAMADAEIAPLADRPVTTLSGGERARAFLARALAGAPRVLLADEPVASLDPYHQMKVMELLRAQAARGGAVVAVLHDLTLAARFCDRLVLLDGGRVAAEGAPTQVLTAQTLARVYGVAAAFGADADGPYVVPRRRLDARPDGTG
jgi:iron complex transport system ATP-binding protein